MTLDTFGTRGTLAGGHETVPTVVIGDTSLVNPSAATVVDVARRLAPGAIDPDHVAPGRSPAWPVRRIVQWIVPATSDLGLDAAGVAVDERGFIRTDDHLRTTSRTIWAAGDIVGRLQLTHAADEMGRIAATNALSRVPLRRYREQWMPAVTFADPEVARVGMTEAAATTTTRGARVAWLPMSDVDRARAAGRRDGFVKLIVGPRRLTANTAGGRLLGATIVAARAGEMIHEPVLVMRARLPPGLLALTPHAYPTWSVAVRQAAAQLFFDVGGRHARPPHHPTP